jgi:tyrosine-specific transport protein
VSVWPLAMLAPMLARHSHTLMMRAPKLSPLVLASESSTSPGLGAQCGASALILGTAIGGGFLALPYTTVPAGCAPSTAVLFICWAWLLTQSLVVAELVMEASYEGDPRETASFATLGNRAFGEAGGKVVGGIFVILMMTTLVGQVSKGAILLGPLLSSTSYSARCMVLAASVAAAVAICPGGLISGVNGFLTASFVAATAALFWQGLPLAVFERLLRADWSASWQSAPSILQLHVYCEVPKDTTRTQPQAHRICPSSLLI